MSEHINHRRNIGQWLLVLLVAVSLIGTASAAWASRPGNNGQTATPQPWEWSPALGPGGQPLTYSAANALPDPAPAQPAETFTNRVFWIVLALVVLGSITLMADFPETN